MLMDDLVDPDNITPPTATKHKYLRNKTTIAFFFVSIACKIHELGNANQHTYPVNPLEKWCLRNRLR